MWRKTLLFVQVGLFVLVAFGAQACFESNTYPRGYGGGYYGTPPVVVGDYDDHHLWHNRDWWVGHDRDWVSNHHHDWLEHHEEHESHEHRG